MKTSVKIEKDGCFSFYAGDRQIIDNAYPGMNGRNIRPLCVKTVSDGTGFWMETLWGTFTLTFCETDRGVVITSRVEGCSGGIRQFSPVCRMDIPGIRGVYQVSGETGDPTGFLSAETVAKKRKIKSAGICPVQVEKDLAVIFYFVDFGKYQNYFEISWEPEGVQISAKTELENICEKEMQLPELYIECTASIQEGLDRAAGKIADHMKIFLDKPASYNWCSWYYCYHNFDQKQLAEYLEGFCNAGEGASVRYFLIDAGYCTSLGDWLKENENWKDGLKSAFDRIRSFGYHPAVWIGPFMVGNRSRLFREHPDWILYSVNGEPVKMLITDNEPKLWNYQDEEYYVLDTSHPEAFAYMRQVFRTLRTWGAEMFKTDFMVWGIQDSSQVKRACPGKTSVEYFREFLQMIREEIGLESYWLGCIAPFFPFLGYADGMRIGGDVGSSWDGRFGPQNMLQSVMGNGFMNHVFYENDPDVVMLRDFHIRLTDKEIESLALFQAMSGNSIYTSDPLHLLSEKRKKLFRFICPDGKRKATQPFLHQERKDLVLIQKNEDGEKALVYILNTKEEELREMYALAEMGFSGAWDMECVAGNGMLRQIKDFGFGVELEAHDCILIYMEYCGRIEKKGKTKRDNIWYYLKENESE